MTTIYVAFEDALLAVDDATGDPNARIRLDGYRPECVVARGDCLFAGTFESGLLRSTDSGATWTRLDGIEEPAVMSLTFAPDGTDTLYAGTEPSAVYRSHDGGDSWERLDGLTDLPSAEDWSFPPRPHTHHARWIAPAPNDASLLYVGIEAGALVRGRLDEDGATWEDRVAGSRIDNHTIATHPARPGHAWVAAGDGYARTSDYGDTWTYPQEGLDHTYCWSIAVEAPDDGPERILMSAASGAGNAHRSPGEAYLYRNHGGDWERLDDCGVPTGEGALRCVLSAGETTGEFWAANNHGLFRTTDGGDSWTAVAGDWPERFADQTCRGIGVVH